MVKRKIIIFGGQGFIGSKLVDFYLRKKYEIISIGRVSNYFDQNKYLKLYKNFQLLEYDFYDLKIINKIDFNQSIVIFSGLNGKNKIREFNKKFTNLILALKNKKINRFILLSSISVYGDNKNKVSETSAINPLNLYAKNCFAAEKIININLSQFNIKYNILRIANVFGVPRNNPSLIEKIILNNIFNKQYTFYKKNLIRSYIEIDVLIQIIHKLSNYQNSLNIYNISNPYYIYSFKKICLIFKKKLKIYNKILYNDDQPLVMKSICNTQKIEEVFTFNDKFVFEIKKIIKYYKEFEI